jgi:hypothetical protein
MRTGGQGHFSVCVSTRLVGSLGVCSPRKVLHFRLPEIASGAFLGTNLILFLKFVHVHKALLSNALSILLSLLLL